MKKSHLIKTIIFATVFIIFSLLFFMAQNVEESIRQHNSHLEYNRARIIEIVADHTIIRNDSDIQDETLANLRQGTVVFNIEVLRGRFSGEILEANYHMHSPMHIDFEVGDVVSVRIFEFDGEIMITEIRYPERTQIVFILIGIFLLFLCIIGGKKGIQSVLGLVFTLICVITLLIPLIVQGYPVILITLIILALVSAVTIILLAGLSAKGVAAILGTMSGVLISALFAQISGILLHINGYNIANYRALAHLADASGISGLFISSVLVAAIGAIMDSCMSVASAMEEVYHADKTITAQKLFKSGFNVSRDVMGTMSSTLILAFIGGSLAMMIFMYATRVSFNQLMNSDMIAIEIIMGISGSIGIILAAPFTAIIATKLMTMDKTKD